MKKLIALVLTLICVATLVACKEEGNEVVKDFVGKVTNINDSGTSCIVRVTDSGTSELEVDNRVIVQTDFERCPEYSVGDYIRVDFNGVVEEIPQISMADANIPIVFAVEKIDIHY